MRQRLRKELRDLQTVSSICGSSSLELEHTFLIKDVYIYSRKWFEVILDLKGLGIGYSVLDNWLKVDYIEIQTCECKGLLWVT